jgi:hypothetical protein
MRACFIDAKRLMRSLGVLLVIATIGTRSPAQTTWIVDSLNQPGANFTNIQAAVNAAADGDRVIVRGNGLLSGTTFVSYACPTIDGKGLTILGTGTLPAFLYGDCVIRNLGASQRVVLTGLALGFSPGFTAGSTLFDIHASNNRGTVILDQNTISIWNNVFGSQRFVDCDLVMITRCNVVTLSQLGIVRSHVAILGSQVLKVLPDDIPIQHALVLTSSTLWLADSRIEGDSGSANYPNILGAAIYSDPSVVYVGHGTTLLGGGIHPRISAVTGLVGNPTPPPVLHWDQSDPSIVVDGPTQWIVPSQPVAALQFHESAGTLSLDQKSIPLSLTLLCAAPIQTAPWVTIAGPAYFAPNPVFLSALGVASSTGQTSRSYTIPPGLPPMSLSFQAFELTPTGGLATTNPAVWGIW